MQINDGLFKASYLSSPFGVAYMETKNDTSQSSLKNAFDVCRIGGRVGSCSIIQLSTYDLISPTIVQAYGVSRYLYQVNNGSCRDSISMDPGGVQNMIDTPFADLVQAYMTCVDPMRTLLLNNLGIATGNVGALLPIGVAFLLIFVHIYSHYADKKIFSEYSPEKMKESLDQLALLLLLQKDGKLSDRIKEFKQVSQGESSKSAKENAIAHVNKTNFEASAALVEELNVLEAVYAVLHEDGEKPGDNGTTTPPTASVPKAALPPSSEMILNSQLAAQTQKSIEMHASKNPMSHEQRL